jgi:hypothetical protein
MKNFVLELVRHQEQVLENVYLHSFKKIKR